MAKIQAQNLSAGDRPPGHVSIIIVTYNAAQYLQNCLNSIYAQEHQGIDIIIIDGKSTDGTVNILANNTSKIHFWLSEKDEGIYDAMNKALPKITGQWVYFLGADDELLPDFSNMVQQLTYDRTIYYGNVLVEGIKRSGMILPYYMAKGGIYHQAIIYPKAVFDNYKYNIKYRIAADYALNMQLYKDKRFKFTYVDLTIAKYNHTGLSSQVEDEAFEKDKTKLILENFETKIGLRYLFRQFKSMIRRK